MPLNENLIHDSVMRDMSEGVMIIGLDGRVSFLNPAAERILGLSAAKTLGRTFAACFLADEANDAFTQMVLEAVYDKSHAHDEVVPFHTGDSVRQLHMVTSFLHDGAETAGIIVVLDDITELAELKIEYARQVTSLLESLVGALSTAIDERSHYTANHTRNMARFAERFLDYLEETGNSWKFDEEKRRTFLMSIWLHDVGKLAVPLEIMDKATRLGPALSDIQKRFTEMALLDRIALLENRISENEYAQKTKDQEDALKLIEHINTAGFLTDDDLAAVRELENRRYTGADGGIHPWLTDSEVTDLNIRRGTLTDEEREIMQSHAIVTEHILSQVNFPAIYAQVPVWAAAHHEQLSGRGYPHHIMGEDIPREVRLLTILDIFEALTARDRPYKGPMMPERALGIMHNMVQEGSIDGDVLELYEASRAWEEIISSDSQPVL